MIYTNFDIIQVKVVFIGLTPGVNFLKIALKYCARHPNFWLLYLVMKFGAKNIFSCSTSSQETAAKKLDAGRETWAQLSKNWPLLSLFFQYSTIELLQTKKMEKLLLENSFSVVK